LDAVHNLTPLALSPANKSVTVQTNKQTKLQTVTDKSTPCLSTRVNNQSFQRCIAAVMLVEISKTFKDFTDKIHGLSMNGGKPADD